MGLQNVQTIIGRLSGRYFIQSCIALALTIALGSLGANAQPFNSGSDGSDGDLDFSGTPSGTTIIFDPRTFIPPLDPDGDGVYHFASITIPTGVTVRLGADILGPTPVVWLAIGAVQINGTIDLNGADGHSNDGARVLAVAGAGGFSGGLGARLPNLPATDGLGPGAGGAALGIFTGGGGAGHATAGEDGNNGGAGGQAYGNVFLLPLVGGSGGGGGGLGSRNGVIINGTGGGAGGGALLVASSASITFGGGEILANGGSSGGFNNGAGGGSGGAIRMMAPVISGSPNLRAGGGTLAAGASGRIRLEAFNFAELDASRIAPTPTFGTPFTVFLPTPQPTIRIVRVAGQDVPATPRGMFPNADVTFNEPSDTTIDIEANQVPLGTVVQLIVYSEDDVNLRTVDTTPLAGNLALSRASAQFTFPAGFSRIFTQAFFTP